MSSRFLHYFLYLILFYHSFNQADAQVPQGNPQSKLLWKISGKGLTKNSYLYGTMHVRDKRVFNLSDSVLLKIKECEYFSLEIHPDSMIKYALDGYPEKESDTTNYLRKQLTSEEYKQLDKKLKAETGLSISSLKNKSFQGVFEILSRPLYRKTDKETFLDAFLYRVALQEEKKITGIEDARQHLDEFHRHYRYPETARDVSQDSISKSETEAIRWYLLNDQLSREQTKLMTLYTEGDPEKIYTFSVNHLGKEQKKSLLTRNLQMADSISSLVNTGSAFVAVGAAHLGGDSGLVSLLRKKGYTLTPVKPVYTGVAAKYPLKPVKHNWYNFESSDFAYNLSYPSKPYNYKMEKEGVNMEMYMYPDLSDGNIYLAIAMTLPQVPEGPAVNNFLNGYLKGIQKTPEFKISDVKNINLHGVPGRSYEMTNAAIGEFVSGEVLIRKSTVYIIMVRRGQKEDPENSYAKKFLSSLSFTDFKPANWETFTSEKGGFKINTPFRMRSGEISDENGVITHLNTANDTEQGIEYLAGYYELPSSNYIPDDSLYLSLIAEGIISTASDGEVSDTVYQGFPAKNLHGCAPAGHCFAGRLILRGNRPYVLLTVAGEKKKDSESIRTFLNSFRITDFAAPEWTTFTDDTAGYTVLFPDTVESEKDSSRYYTDGILYTRNSHSSDRNSSLNYLLEKKGFGPYFWQKRDSLYKFLLHAAIDEEFRIVSEKDVSINGISGREIILKPLRSHLYRKTTMIPDGDQVYILTAFTFDSLGNDINSTKFCNSFKIKNPQNVNLYSSKLKLLLSDLQSNDSVTQARATANIYRFNYQKEDLAVLKKAIEISYSDDTLTNYYSTKSKLIEKIENLSETPDLAFLTEIYGKNAENPYIQASVLESMLKDKTGKGLKLFLDITSRKIPDVTHMPYSITGSLSDSAELLLPFKDKLFALSRHEAMRNPVYELFVQLADSGLIKPEEIDVYQNDINSNAAKDLEVLNRDSISYEYKLYNTVNLIGKTRNINLYSNTLQNIFQSEDNELALSAMKVMMSNNIACNQERIGKIADDLSTRYNLYQELKQKEKIRLFPEQYLNQEALALSNFQNHLSNFQDTYTQKLRVDGNRVLEYNGGKYRFYLISFQTEYEDEDNKWYTGICGPFPADKKILETSGEANYTNWEDFKSKSAKEHYKELLNPESVETEF
jgi:uncharacterized protein YbaP (TraB family)